MNSKNKLNFLLLFVISLVTFSFSGCAENKIVRTTDLATIQQKIDAGEIKHLTIKPEEIIAVDRAGVEYHAPAANEFYKAEIMKRASELDANGKRKVERVDVSQGDNNWFSGVFGFPILSLLLIVAVGVVGFMLGRASKTLR